MKIIKGPSQFAPFEADCSRCYAEVLIEKLEDLTRTCDQRDGNFTWFECPCCQYSQCLPESVVPVHLLWRIRTK
jgi:hypothetical protein